MAQNTIEVVLKEKFEESNKAINNNIDTIKQTLNNIEQTTTKHTQDITQLNEDNASNVSEIADIRQEINDIKGKVGTIKKVVERVNELNITELESNRAYVWYIADKKYNSDTGNFEDNPNFAKWEKFVNDAHGKGSGELNYEYYLYITVEYNTDELGTGENLYTLTWFKGLINNQFEREENTLNGSVRVKYITFSANEIFNGTTQTALTNYNSIRANAVYKEYYKIVQEEDTPTTAEAKHK